MWELLEFLNIDTEQIILYIILFICLWLLLREVKCWYWKINDILNEQKKQTRILEEILSNMNPKASYFDKEDDEKEGKYIL